MKYILLILTLTSFSFLSVFSQEISARKIEGKSYKGYAFPASYSTFGFKHPEIGKSCTPTEQDIQRAETILNDSIEVIIKDLSPNIKRGKLKKYTRQYFGFINDKNEIIIYINLFKNIDKERKSMLDKEILLILDGGDDYWQIYINIDKKELFGLLINGVA